MPDPARQQAQLEWVPLEEMRVDTARQRELRPHRVDYLVAHFDPEEIGAFTVNYRNGVYWVIDGQHRKALLEALGWGDQSVPCWVYKDLAPQEEAESFLKRNDILAVSGFDKFKVAVEAGRPDECQIAKIVEDTGLRISREGARSVNAVGTLRKVYARGGPQVLADTLALAWSAYSDAGLAGRVLGGLGLFVGRYRGMLDMERAIEQLGTVPKGITALTQRAQSMRLQTGNQMEPCIAAAAVELYNRSRRGTKLPNWWREVND